MFVNISQQQPAPVSFGIFTDPNSDALRKKTKISDVPLQEVDHSVGRQQVTQV